MVPIRDSAQGIAQTDPRSVLHGALRNPQTKIKAQPLAQSFAFAGSSYAFQESRPFELATAIVSVQSRESKTSVQEAKKKETVALQQKQKELLGQQHAESVRRSELVASVRLEEENRTISPKLIRAQ